MKRLLLSSFAFLSVMGAVFAQCSPGVSYGSGTAPSPGNNQTYVTCAFAGEYTTVSSVVSGQEYTVTYTGTGTEVTIFDGTFTAVAFSTTQSVTFTAATSGTFYSQINTTGCGTLSSCHSVNWAATLPPCFNAPSNGTASNITDVSADLTWLADAGAVNYVVEWGTPGFAPGTGAELGTTSPATNSTSATGLSPNTTYEFYVMTDCGGGTTSTWGGPFSFTTQPTCFNPTALTATNITGGSADLGWTETGSATMWNIEWGPAGFTQGTGTMITGTTNNPEPLSGLSSTTSYEFYVQADCGGGDVSNWIGPFTFMTTFNAPVGVTCSAGFATMVFSDDMETAAGWTGDISTAAGDWDFPTASPGGNSSSTGPSGPASGVTYAEYEASGSQALASMVTPMIDLTTGSSEAELSFYMHAYGSEIGTLNVGVGTSPTGPFTNVFSWTGQYQTSATQAWEHIGVDISAYLGQQIYVEFAYAATGPNFYGDLAIDLVQVETCITCPAPTNFNTDAADFTTGTFSWTENGAATEWQLEYGPIGFTQGTGTVTGSTANPETVTGLTPNSFYEIYVQSVCGVGDSSTWTGPIVFNTYNQGLYMEADTDCGPGFIDITATGVLNTLGDDGEVGVTMPFPLLYQGTLYQDITIGSNGAILFGTLTGQVGFTNGTMAGAADGLYPYWDDLYTELNGTLQGVYYQTIGTAPNQQFVIQWVKNHISGNNTLEYIFEIIIDEASGEIFYVYDQVNPGNTGVLDYGGSATLGVAGPNQDIQVSYNNQQYLMDNSCAHFYYTNCPKPQNYAVSYTTTSEAAITWSAGLSNETEWTVTFVEQGLDPVQWGITVSNITGTALVLPGLDDATCYDVYVYADCNTNLQSLPLTGSFCTLPNCADPSAFAGATAVDSIFTSWNWTANPGYDITEFAMEYGLTGFNNGSGNYVWGVDTVTYIDTIADPALIGGALYDVYIQAICGADSSYWVGPITVTMPLTNDSTCMAEELMVDGTVYTFNGAGATAALGESAIAPAAGSCTGTMTWCNSSITASTWFTFTAPASGNVRIDGESAGFDGQIAIYETNDCSNFNVYNLIGANDDDPAGGGGYPFINICGLTPGNTYYLMHDPYSSIGIYSLRLQDVVVEAGTDNGLLNICLGDMVDLNTQLTNADAGGYWTEDIPTAGFNDPMWSSAGLASQVFTFEYMVVDGCAMDSVETQVEVYAPSYAGLDGGLTACLNEPISLNDGLSGNGVDLGGTWYNPANNVTSPNINSGQVPGQFNYDYIAGNGVCPDDTANIVLTVDPTCNFLNINEALLEGMEIYPNPTTNVFYISNEGSSEVFSYELTDLNGKIITSKDGAINGTEATEVSVENLETGVYLIRIFNENTDKTFRVVKQ